MISRLAQAADFERVLAAPSKSRSAHFALHHLAQAPLPVRKPVRASVAKDVIPSLTTDLSTASVPDIPAPVDDLPAGQWLGYVIPKRHAKRAATRNLLKRQIRAVFEAHAAGLPGGQWLVRLRQPFVKTLFVSARSDALAEAARGELEQLLGRAAIAVAAMRR